MKQKNKLTADYIMDYWLTRGHGITVQWLIENESDLIKTKDWYLKYPVSAALHDEWYKWATKTISKHYKISIKSAQKRFVWDYLNLAPSVIKNERD